MKLSVKSTDFFTIPLRHSFFGKNYVVFYREKLQCFFTGKNFSAFLQGKKPQCFFYREKLRSFLQGKNLSAFFTGKNYGLFYKGKLRTFLLKNYVLFYMFGVFFTMKKPFTRTFLLKNYFFTCSGSFLQ